MSKKSMSSEDKDGVLVSKPSEQSGEFWVLPLPKWDRGTENLDIGGLASKQSIHDAEFKNKRVLVRVDYNVPLKDGKITDDARITSTLETIRAIRAKEPQCIVLICH